MKIVQIGDIHVPETRIKEFEEMLPELAKSIRDEKPDLVVITGDLVVHRDRLTPKQVELIRKFVKEDLFGIEKFLITGNHDVSMSATKIDSLSAIFTFDEVKVYTKIGDYIDIDGYRFHMFPYPTKFELERLGVKDVSEINPEGLFKLAGKNDVLVFHGVVSGSSMNDRASEELISVGKELVIQKDFWAKFDATFAGHIHKYQKIGNAVYSGTPFPLTFADEFSTGFVVWEDLKPRFVPIKQLYPFKTIDIGYINSSYVDDLTKEAERRLETTDDFTNCRLRIRYTIDSKLAGEVNHSVIAAKFNAKEIKIDPIYKQKEEQQNITDDFRSTDIFSIIKNYIEKHKYHPEVLDIADEVEKKVAEKYSHEELNGIHFKLHALELSNFKSFGEVNPRIEFNKLNQLVGLFGVNKAGKSSLLESIIWGLFGTTPRNKDVKSIIRNNEDQCKVSVEFYSYETLYKVERVRGTKSNLNLFYWNNKWIDISGGNMTETQRQIEAKVGSYDMFISTIYSPQNGVDLLIKKKPSERKQIIIDCLQIDVLEKRQEEIQEIKRVVKDKLFKLKATKDVHSERINELLEENPSKQLAQNEHFLEREKEERTRLNSHIASLTKKVYDYEELENENVELKSEDWKLTKELKDYEVKSLHKVEERQALYDAFNSKGEIDVNIEKIRKAQETKERYAREQETNLSRQKKISELRIKQNEIADFYKGKLDDLYRSRTLMEESLADIKLINCTKEDCPINEQLKEKKDNLLIKIGEVTQTIEKTEAEKLTKISEQQDKIFELEAQVENSFFDVQDYQDVVSFLASGFCKKWIGLHEKVKAGYELVKNLDELIGAYNSKIQEIKKRRHEILIRRDEIATKLNMVNKYQQEIDRYKKKLIEVETFMNEYENNVYKYKRDLEEITTLQKKLKEVETRIGMKEAYLLHCNKYSEIVSKDGILYSVVDSAVPILEKYCQDLLSLTTNGMVSVSMDSYKKLQSGGTSDEVIIWLSDAKGKRDVGEASGSELVLISLVLRAAMSHLLSLRTGSKVELFVIDEGFGVFDSDNLITIKDLMRHLGKQFNLLVYITHVEELKDVAESTIEVESNGLVSNFTIRNEK